MTEPMKIKLRWRDRIFSWPWRPWVGWMINPEVDTTALRDYFAGQALANRYTDDEGSPDKVAEWAYHVADAMVKERDK